MAKWEFAFHLWALLSGQTDTEGGAILSWLSIGPTSETLAQHWAKIAPARSVCRGYRTRHIVLSRLSKFYRKRCSTGVDYLVVWMIKREYRAPVVICNVNWMTADPVQIVNLFWNSLSTLPRLFHTDVRVRLIPYKMSQKQCFFQFIQ